MSDFTEIGPDALAALNDLDDDDLLASRMKNVVFGDVRPDPEGETVDEQSRLILSTIMRQLQSGCASRAALGYIAHCLDRRLSGQVASLDEAFYMKHKRPPGGQATPVEVDRATVRAFMNVIRPNTREFDRSIGGYVYSVPSKSVLREAYHAAYVAYRKAVGKNMVEDNEPEKKINQTIKPILRRTGVFR
jgi:hypothetical protein